MPVSPTPAESEARRRNLVRWTVYALLAEVLIYIVFALVFPGDVSSALGAEYEALTGANPHPIVLKRGTPAPLSDLAQLGRALFFDPSLSLSGQQSCASCHSPAHAYGPPNNLPAQLGGPHMDQLGIRPPPSLMYLYRQPPFSIGPDTDDDVSGGPPTLEQLAASAANGTRLQKVAGAQEIVPQLVPQGGLFWDGRADTLDQQALGPMLNPAEMANPSVASVAAKFQASRYAPQFLKLFGPRVFDNPRHAVADAMFAIARFQIEDVSFHPYNSKYDHWLEGKVRLSRAELRGMRLFNDPDKANCAGCHLSKPFPNGAPPLFTDFQYEALGVPRNPALPQNRAAGFYDMGICGPLRTDLKTQTQYCGMFLTPSLRNSAVRPVFFHNGIYRSLTQVLDFYNSRDTDPARIYPRTPTGQVLKFNDLPPQYRGNIDTSDAPFTRHFGDPPAMSDQDMRDIIAFLQTLTDEPPQAPANP